MSVSHSPPPPFSVTTTTNMSNHLPGGVVYQRLEHLEAQLTLVQGFIQKLFGNNFEEYCRSRVQYKYDDRVPKNNGYECKSSGRNSPFGEPKVSKTEDRLEQQHEKGRHDAILNQVDKECDGDGCEKRPPTQGEDVTSVTNIASSSNDSNPIVPQLYNRAIELHHSSDTFVNPFLSGPGEENDPIAIDGCAEDKSPPGSGNGDAQVYVNQENTEVGSGQEATAVISGSEATAEAETQSCGREQDPPSEQGQHQLLFFDDGVDQQQFAGYFEEEDVEPFDALDEERDVKILTILDMAEHSNVSTSTSSAGQQNSYQSTKEDMKPIRIKPEHGQILDSDDNNIIENGSGSPGSGDQSRTKRRAASFPSTSTSKRGRGRGRPPNSGRIHKAKEGDNKSSDEDSDFQLESGEENAAEFSSSSSSDNDPDWTAKPKSQSLSHQPHLQNKIIMGGGGLKSRRGRRPNCISSSRIPPNLVPLLPKTATTLPGTFDPKGPIVLNLSSSPSMTMIPIPGNKFHVPVKRGRPQVLQTNPPRQVLPTTKINPPQPFLLNPIAQLPKVINGVYFRLISLTATADKNHGNLMVVKAKCAMCDAKGSQPVIVSGFGRSESSFYEHFMAFHPAEFLHYRTNAQRIDAATVKLRQVIAKSKTNSGFNSEAVFISQHLRKITNLDFLPS